MSANTKDLMSPDASPDQISKKVGVRELIQNAHDSCVRRKVEENSEYVGVNFVAEARKMHEGSVPERSIYGEARPEEAIKLLEEGVPLAPLPFMPTRKVN